MPPIKCCSLSTKWGARSSPSVLACFVSNWSFVYSFLPIQIRQTHEVWTQFHNFELSKISFLSSRSKQLRWFHGRAKADDIDIFQRSRLRQLCPTSRTWDLIYAMHIARENAAVMMQGSLSHLRYHYPTFVGVDEHHETEDEKADYEPSRKNLDCKHEFPSCSLLETSVCVNAYIVEITIFAYDFRLDCLIGFNSDA